MTTKAQRRSIRTRIEAGDTPQRVYDELHGPGLVADEGLADAVRYVPTMERRARYRTAPRALLILLGFAIVWQFAFVLPSGIQKEWPFMIFHTGLGVGFSLGLVAVASYWRGAHSAVGNLGGGALMIQHTSLYADNLAVLLSFGTLMFLGHYLQRKLTPEYVTVKEKYTNTEGQARLREAVHFGDRSRSIQ